MTAKAEYDPDDQYANMMSFIDQVETDQAYILGHWLYSNLKASCVPEPLSVIDIGCGTGVYLLAYKDRGCVVLGIDLCPTGGQQLNSQEFCRVDLRDPLKLDKHDLAICLEVAEHLEEQYADTLMDTLCACADIVLFSGSVPGQGGTYHFNEQPHEYWLSRFESRGFIIHPLQEKLRLFLSTLPGYCSGWLKNNSYLMMRKAEEQYCPGVEEWWLK